MTWPGIIGLGEMMNYSGVYNGDDKVHAEMAVTRQSEKAIGGHYASPDLGLPFHGYVAGGPGDDHEGTRLEDAVARARQGMVVMMRYGSAWHDVAAQVKAVTELGMDSRHFVLCTDDSHSETLTDDGHMDRVIRHAVSLGLDPVTAIQMATINTAEYFGLGRELGSIAPGRFADILLVKDIKDLHADLVIARGVKAAEEGCLFVEMPVITYPKWVLHSVHLLRPLSAEDFRLTTPLAGPQAKAHVIGVLENQAPTRHLELKVPVVRGEVCTDISRDLAKVAMVERHRQTGRVQVALVQGFGFTEPCAVASSVAHDSHHINLAGTDDADMAMAVNALAEWGGGQVVVRGREIIGRVELSIAGLMSSERGEIVSKKAATVLDGFRACGCRLNNPNMQLSLLGLVVIPELRISDLGLVDVNRFDFIQVLE